jgi:hypothetical protein
MNNIDPRFVRQKNAPDFFDVSRGYFDKHLRPFLTEIPLGNNPQAGIVYDLYDLHALADIIKERNGRPAKGGTIWDAKNHKVSSSLNERTPLTCTSKGLSSTNELDKALAPHRKKKQP